MNFCFLFILYVYTSWCLCNCFVAGVNHIGDKLVPVSLLPAISYRRCCVTGDKLIAGAMKLMKSGTKLNHQSTCIISPIRAIILWTDPVTLLYVLRSNLSITVCIYKYGWTILYCNCVHVQLSVYCVYKCVSLILEKTGVTSFLTRYENTNSPARHTASTLHSKKIHCMCGGITKHTSIIYVGHIFTKA